MIYKIPANVPALIPGHKQVNLAEEKANDKTYIKLVFVDFCDQKTAWKPNHSNSQIDGLVRERRNSIAYALELL